nr:cadherin-like domain-containing protein [uncultured Noviherbaspirillum sp.]
MLNLKTPDSSNAEKQNSFSAAFVEFIGRILIEKMFFQNLHIPQDVLLSVVNNLIRTVAPEQTSNVDVYQEGIILCKQLMGKELTPEELRYEQAAKEIDVPGKILNGIKYSALALMGGSLYNSVTSAVNQGLISHLPAIVGYGGAIVFGPRLIQGAVEKVLAYSGLTPEQKQQLTPWLNTIGRLALGFMPKVSANEQGVQYRHPSMEGNARIVSSQGAVTISGDKITVEQHGSVHVAAEESKVYDAMQFRLHGIREITKDRIKLYVIDQKGQKVGVEFSAMQSGLDKAIAVRSSDKYLEGYWNQEIRSVLPAVQTGNLACHAALVVGAVASTVGQNALPALIATLSCWPKASAFNDRENGLGTSTSKRAVLQQQFPAIFDLNSLDGNNGFVLPGVVANSLLGVSVSVAGDINGDDITDLVLGAIGANANLGASYVIFGSRSPFLSTFNLTQLNGSNGFTIPGLAAGGNLGQSVSSAGDINGDNITDLVLGAGAANASRGASYVIFGSRSPFPATFNLSQLNGTNGFIIPGIAASGQLGTSVSTTGDINGDGITDLVLGAYTTNTNIGTSYIIFGNRSPFPATFNLTQLNGTNGFTIPGVTTGGRLGYSASNAGDINNDNITDLVLGAYSANAGMGVSYVIFGSRIPFPASFNLSQLNGPNGFTIPGLAISGRLGNSVRSAGDINGDNITDLVLAENGGVAAGYVIFGSQSSFPSSFNLTQLDGSNGFIINGVAASAPLGISVGSAGDINGDNITDLVLGVPGAYADMGASYVIFGSRSPFPASFNILQLNGTNGFTIPGVKTNGYLGSSVSNAGDLNGDNITDLMLGAYNANSGLGASYVIFGKNTSARILTPTPLTPCPSTQPLNLQNNAIQINQAQILRVTPNDFSANCGNNTTPNLKTLFNITGISHAQFKTRNSSGVWTNASSFLGNDLSQGNVELIRDNSTLAPEINLTVTDGQTTLPETPVSIQFNVSETTPVVTAINFDIQKNGTTTLTPQQFQITGVGTQLDNVVVSVTYVEGGYFTTRNDTAHLADFSFYQVKDAQIQFVHNGTTLPNMTLTVGDGSAAPVAFTPLVHFFNTDNPNNPAVPVETVVGGAIGAVAVTAAIGMTALGVNRYRQYLEEEEERNDQTPELRAVANPLQVPLL